MKSLNAVEFSVSAAGASASATFQTCANLLLSCILGFTVDKVKELLLLHKAIAINNK